MPKRCGRLLLLLLLEQRPINSIGNKGVEEEGDCGGRPDDIAILLIYSATQMTLDSLLVPHSDRGVV